MTLSSIVMRNPLRRPVRTLPTLAGIAIGIACVTNTVLMSKFERVREIGILLAPGWPAPRAAWRPSSLPRLPSCRRGV